MIKQLSAYLEGYEENAGETSRCFPPVNDAHSQVRSQIEKWASLAKQGDESSIAILADIGVETSISLWQGQSSQLEKYRKIASKRDFWPSVASSESNFELRLRRKIAELEVGSDSDCRFSLDTALKSENPSTQIAMILRGLLKLLRVAGKFHALPRSGNFLEVMERSAAWNMHMDSVVRFLGYLDSFVGEEPLMSDEVGAKIQSEAAKLPELSYQTRREWAVVAVRVLEELYGGNLEKRAKFVKFFVSASVDQSDYKKRDEIASKIKSAFCNQVVIPRSQRNTVDRIPNGDFQPDVEVRVSRRKKRHPSGDKAGRKKTSIAAS